MNLTRRTALFGIVAAPAIVSAPSLMRLSTRHVITLAMPEWPLDILDAFPFTRRAIAPNAGFTVDDVRGTYWQILFGPAGDLLLTMTPERALQIGAKSLASLETAIGNHNDTYLRGWLADTIRAHGISATRKAFDKCGL